MSNSWEDSYLGITPTANGGIMTNSGITLDPLTLPNSTTSNSNSTSSSSDCPSWSPAWLCTFVSVIGSPGAMSGAHGGPGPLAKSVGDTTTNAATSAQQKLTGSQKWTEDTVKALAGSLLLTGGAILLGVLIIVLGAWSIVKD